MKVLSSLRRRTKTGVSVWHFCHVQETNQFFAVGGDDMKTIVANDRKHLRTIYNNFRSYGYATKLPTKKIYINDPWSDLPINMQQELELLSA